MSEQTSDKQLDTEEIKRKFAMAIDDFAKGIKLKKHRRGDNLLRVQKSFTVKSRKWNKIYLSNYISKY